jgi:hypothetical protein
MKKIFKLSSLALLMFLGVSCSEDDQTIATPSGGPELLNPESGTAYVLAPENASSDLVTLVWDHADYSVQTVVNYELEVALAGTDFETPVSAGTTVNRYYTWKVEDLNTVAVAAGLSPFTAGDIDVRLKSTLGSNQGMSAYSNVITLTVTPYSTDLPLLYVIGNFLSDSGYGDNWTPAVTLPALAASAFGKTDFEGYVYINVASPELKFLPTNTSFDGDWGDDGSFTGTLVQTGESNVTLAAPGYYRVNANTGAPSTNNPGGLTYNFQQVSSWGIIGAATPTGWDSDTNMTYNTTTKKWEIIIALTAGEFKFRYNDTWNQGETQLNLGAFDPAKTGLNYAGESMSYGGLNIPVATAGTYLVQLDLTNPRDYKYTLTLQ